MNLLDRFKKENKKELTEEKENIKMNEELNQEAVFKDVEEEMPTEYPEEMDASEEPQLQVERGVLIFHDQDGSLRYQQVGEVSLENITFYRRYLEELEKNLWKKELAGENNA